MDDMRNGLVPAVGRLLLSALFVWGGYGKAMMMQGTIGYFAAIHVPMPLLAYGLSVVVELLGGLAMLFGLLTRPVALILAAWCLATAALGHGFGDMESQINTMKNIAICGGFLFVFAHGAGTWSLDAVLARSRRAVQAA